MTLASSCAALRAKLADAWRTWPFSRKAFTFAAIGVVNTLVDYSVFLLARMALLHSAAALAAIGSFAQSCRCGNATSIILIVSNLVSWSVAVSGSYILNSSITFAAETGRQLSRRRYLAFVASGVLGWLTNTATLLVAAELLLLPVWLAKAVAILASFLVNFSLSHFVVFRVRGAQRNGRDEI